MLLPRLLDALHHGQGGRREEEGEEEGRVVVELPESDAGSGVALLEGEAAEGVETRAGVEREF